MADIEGMFLKVHVAGHFLDLLRFLWWEDDDLRKEPTRYRITVHLFGAGSSSGCCNFALKKTADDHEKEFGSEPAEFLRNDFYVDDGLKSVPSECHAKELINKLKRCAAVEDLISTNLTVTREKSSRAYQKKIAPRASKN